MLPGGYRYFWYEEVSSTNLEAWRRLFEMPYQDSWHCARRQLDGRGTGGRKWVSEAGNLYCSLATRVSCSPDQWGQISILAALAAFTAIEQFAPPDTNVGDLCLKWPNDIVLNGHKICGILIESRPSTTGDQQDIVIGSGINLVTHPPVEALFPAGNLRQFGWTCERDELFAALVSATRDWFTIWRNGEDFAPLRLAWLERSCHIGHQVTVRVGERNHTGRFSTISQQGAMVLVDEEGRETVFPSAHMIASGRTGPGSDRGGGTGRSKAK